MFGAAGRVRLASADAEVVRRLRAAGAVIVGKTNTCELGQWPFTSGPAFGHTRNPWSRNHTPGGSSGGSAAAVAAGLVTAAIGSDGAGSVRIPAAWTHLVGIKPQRGRISTWPLPEAFNGITVNGVLARTVIDAALLLDAASGNVDGDRHKPPPVQAAEAVGRAPGPLKIALSTKFPFNFFRPRLHPDIRAALHTVSEQLTELGHTIVSADPDYSRGMSWNFLSRSTSGLLDWADRLGHGVELDRRTVANLRMGRLLSENVLRKARAREAAAQRRVGYIFNLVDVDPGADHRAAAADGAPFRQARRPVHRSGDDPRLPGDVAVEPAGLAVDQRPCRFHLRGVADRRAVDGSCRQRAAADLAGRRAGGDQRLGDQAARTVVERAHRGQTVRRPARVRSSSVTVSDTARRCAGVIPVFAVLGGAIAGMPAASADNKRLNDGVVANVYTIQQQRRL